MTPSGNEITSGKATADLRQTEIAGWLRPAVLRGFVLVTRSLVKLAIKVESVASGARTEYHDSEYSNARDLTLRFQQFGDNVVQLFPDDDFNQVPPGW